MITEMNDEKKAQRYYRRYFYRFFLYPWYGIVICLLVMSVTIVLCIYLNSRINNIVINILLPIETGIVSSCIVSGIIILTDNYNRNKTALIKLQPYYLFLQEYVRKRDGLTQGMHNKKHLRHLLKIIGIKHAQDILKTKPKSEFDVVLENLVFIMDAISEVHDNREWLSRKEQWILKFISYDIDVIKQTVISLIKGKLAISDEVDLRFNTDDYLEKILPPKLHYDLRWTQINDQIEDTIEKIFRDQYMVMEVFKSFNIESGKYQEDNIDTMVGDMDSKIICNSIMRIANGLEALRKIGCKSPIAGYVLSEYKPNK